MPWRTVVVAGLAALLAGAPGSTFAQGGSAASPLGRPAAPAPPVSLVTTFADGRVTESLITPVGKRSVTPTPYFPRVDGWREPEGLLPVAALQITANAENDGVRIRVTVLRGDAYEVEQDVTETFVTAHAPRVLDELERVGVRRVTFSLKRFVAPALPVPNASSRIEGLIVEGVEPFLEPAPGYRITVRNHTDVGVVTLAYDTAAGGRPALQGQQGDPSAQVTVAPGATFTFSFSLRGGRETGASMATATPIDEVVLTGVIWADGRVDGATARTAPLMGLHRGRLYAVESVIEILSRHRRGGDPITRLRAVREAIDALPVSPIATRPDGPRLAAAEDPGVAYGRQNVRQRLVADIDRVTPSITPATAQQWLDEALPACEAWRDRLRALFPTP